MFIVERPQTNPYFNAAAEEYLMKSIEGDAFMIWRNEPSVIIGKHQNTNKEINQKFVYQKDLPVVRRISGGGAVFHDPGNINFTFIFSGRTTHPIDFKLFTQPVIAFLRSVGLEVELQGKSNLTIHGKKISGNAAHVFRDKVIYHGTLLFDTDLNSLHASLKQDKSRYNGNTINSQPANVVNLREYFPSLTVADLSDLFVDHIVETNPGSILIELSDADIKNIFELSENKYSTWEWNFGYSPEYIFTNDFFTGELPCHLKIEVKRGIIRMAQVFTGMHENFDGKMELMLLGKQHDYKVLSNLLTERSVINDLKPDNDLYPDILNQLLNEMF